MRLQARRPEIDEAVFACVRDATISDPVTVSDSEFVAGRRVAINEVLDYLFQAIGHGEEQSGPIPSALIIQVQRAARMGVGLDSLLRVYVVGNTLLADFILEESSHLPSQALRDVLKGLGSLADGLMTTVASEYEQEIERTRRSREQRHVELVQRLLAGERVDVGDLGYNFDAWHLGLIITGALAEDAVGRLVTKIGCELLSVARGNETVWAWLGGLRTIAFVEIERLLRDEQLAGMSVAIGEPGRGIDGWRLTHQQAEAALPLALRLRERLVRYADCPLLIAALQDDTLSKSLREIYLFPLGSQSEAGTALIQTLRAYLSVGYNAASAAHCLGVDRKTVERRISKIEKSLHRSLHACHAELEVALRLDELDDTAVGKGRRLDGRRLGS